MRGGALGDVLVTFPVLEALVQGGWEVVLAAPARPGRLALQTGLVRRVLDLGGMEALWLFGAGDPPADLGCSLAVSYIPGLEPVLARAGIHRVLGADPTGPGRPIHRQLLRALAPLGLQDAPIASGHRWPQAPPTGPVIAPGSGGRGRSWPLDLWARVDALLGQRALWVGGPVEAEVGVGWPVPPDRRRYVTDLVETADLMARATVWIGNDTGTTHLADWVGAPTLALFGPSDPATWCPPGARWLPFSATPHEVAREALALERPGGSAPGPVRAPAQ